MEGHFEFEAMKRGHLTRNYHLVMTDDKPAVLMADALGMLARKHAAVPVEPLYAIKSLC
jgi:hypothetical protein